LSVAENFLIKRKYIRRLRPKKFQILHRWQSLANSEYLFFPRMTALVEKNYFYSLSEHLRYDYTEVNLLTAEEVNERIFKYKMWSIDKPVICTIWPDINDGAYRFEVPVPTTVELWKDRLIFLYRGHAGPRKVPVDKAIDVGLGADGKHIEETLISWATEHKLDFMFDWVELSFRKSYWNGKVYHFYADAVELLNMYADFKADFYQALQSFFEFLKVMDC